MSDYDHAASFAAQADPAVVIGQLLRATRQRLRFREWFNTRAIPLPGGPKRTADLVALLEHPDSPDRLSLLILEFQSEHDPEKLETTLVETAVFRAYARHGDDRQHRYRVVVGMVYLNGRCPEPVLDMTLTGGFGTRHAPLLWEVGADDAEAALKRVAEGRENWGLLFWIPLMTGAEREDIIRRWRELVSDPARISSAWMRKNLVSVAFTFAELAGRFLIWEHGLEGMDMIESPFLNRFRTQGKVEAKRAYLLKLLQTKFPKEMSPEVKQMVEQQADLDLLDQWFGSALEKETFAEFVQTLK